MNLPKLSVAAFFAVTASIATFTVQAGLINTYTGTAGSYTSAITVTASQNGYGANPQATVTGDHFFGTVPNFLDETTNPPSATGTASYFDGVWNGSHQWVSANSYDNTRQWIDYNLNASYTLHSMKVWNNAYDWYTGYGIQTAYIWYSNKTNPVISISEQHYSASYGYSGGTSPDGYSGAALTNSDWTMLGTGVISFAESILAGNPSGNEFPAYWPMTINATIIDFGGVQAQHVYIDIESSWGGDAVGLSQVQFFDPCPTVSAPTNLVNTYTGTAGSYTSGITATASQNGYGANPQATVTGDHFFGTAPNFLDETTDPPSVPNACGAASYFDGVWNGSHQWVSANSYDNTRQWIDYNLNASYTLGSMKVWNNAYDWYTGYGIQTAFIWYSNKTNPVISISEQHYSASYGYSGGTSPDGYSGAALTNSDWTMLGTGVISFAESILAVNPSGNEYPAYWPMTINATTIDFGGVLAQHVYIDIESSWGGDAVGLSQVQFFGASVTNPPPTPSTLILTGIAREGNDIRLTWIGTGGNTNAVQVTSGSNGGYSPNGFTDLSSLIVLPGTTDVTTNYVDIGGATNGPARFYRIRRVP